MVAIIFTKKHSDLAEATTGFRNFEFFQYLDIRQSAGTEHWVLIPQNSS
jgi:hypothetical protein